MRGSIFLLRPSSFNGRKAGKIFFFSLFLPLSLYPFFLSLIPCFFFSFPDPVSLPFLPYPTKFLLSLFVLTSFFFSFSIFPFSLLFSSFFFFFFYFLLLLASPTRVDQVGETSPHFPPWPLVITMFFFLIFFIFFFPFITSCNTWLNVSHLFQVHHMALAMCHSLGVPYSIYMIMP